MSEEEAKYLEPEKDGQNSGGESVNQILENFKEKLCREVDVARTQIENLSSQNRVVTQEKMGDVESEVVKLRCLLRIENAALKITNLMHNARINQPPNNNHSQQ